jgi:hypothetical protein
MQPASLITTSAAFVWNLILAAVGFGVLTVVVVWVCSRLKRPPPVRAGVVIVGVVLMAIVQTWQGLPGGWRHLDCRERKNLIEFLRIAKGCGAASIWVTSTIGDRDSQDLAEDISDALAAAGWPQPVRTRPSMSAQTGIVIVALPGMCVTALQQAVRDATRISVAISTSNLLLCRSRKIQIVPNQVYNRLVSN